MGRTRQIGKPTLVRVARIADGNRTAVSLRGTFGDLIDTATTVRIRGTTLPIRTDGRVETTSVITRADLGTNTRVQVTLFRN